MCFSRLLMTFTGKRSKEASKIEKKKNSCELISDAYQTYYMRKWLYMLLVSHWPTCNKRHLSKLFPVKSTCTSTNSIYFQLVKYICKIFYSNTTIYNSQGYLAKGDQLDHRKITTTLDKRVCLSQSVVHKKATQSIKSENW